MAYVEIPKISVNLPIYHGAGDDSLNRGVGHLLGSALPVGGENCNSVIVGHGSWNGYKYFLDIELLQYGDEVYITNR